MTTTELVEKWQREARAIVEKHENGMLRAGVDVVDVDYELIAEARQHTWSDLDTLISQIIADTERVTVERIEKEFGDFAHTHYLGCHADELGKWHYSYDTEVVYIVDEFFKTTPPPQETLVDKE